MYRTSFAPDHRLVRMRAVVFTAAAVLAAATVVAATGIVPLGSDFELTPPAAGVGIPSLCARAGGGFALARSEGAPGSAQVLLKRLDTQGKPQGADFVVNTYAGGYATDPDIACNANGGFAVVWSDRIPLDVENDGTLDDDVLARVFDAGGNPVGDPFRVNAYTAGNQRDAAVCALGADAFAVIWQDRRRDEIDARVVTSAGPATDPAEVAEDPRAAMPPDVACAGEGKFLVVWGDFPSADVNDEVEARLFSSDATAVAPRFFVNSYTTGDQGYPVACGSSDAGFVVAWRDTVNRRAPGRIKARHVSLSGAVEGAGFEVSPEGRDRAQISCGAESGFIVTTHASVEGVETLYAQAVDADRNLVGSEIAVDEGPTTLGKLAPPLAGDGGERFLIAWPSVVSPTSQSLRGRLFRIGEGATTTTTAVAPTTTTTGEPTTTIPSNGGECGDAASVATVRRVATITSADITISDALAVLRAAVAGAPCDLCRCDTDGSGNVTVRDALRILARSVGLSVELSCPPCT